MTDVNIPLLRKAVEWVEEQDALPQIDSEWMQCTYLSQPREKAYRMLYTVFGKELAWELTPQVTPHCGTAFCVAGYVAQLLNSRYTTAEYVGGIHISDFARHQLGIATDEQAAMLFNGVNTAADVRRAAEHIAGEKL